MFVLIGVAVVIVGFALRINALLVVTVAGIVTAAIGGIGPVGILDAFGNGFASSRSVTTFALVLPVIGLIERYGLQDQAKRLIAKLDKLESYAKGFGHAHALHIAANAPSRTVTELAARAIELAASLESDASVLARRGLLDPAQFARLTVKTPGKRPHKTLVFQLIGLEPGAHQDVAGSVSDNELSVERLSELDADLVAKAGDGEGYRKTMVKGK